MTRLQHIALKTNDLEATRAFYLGYLNLSGKHNADNLWVNFEDGFVLRFGQTEEAINPTAVQYLGLELESFDAVDQMYENLTPQVSIYRDVRETYRHAQGPYGFFVYDPNGYLIKVFRYTTPT